MPPSTGIHRQQLLTDIVDSKVQGLSVQASLEQIPTLAMNMGACTARYELPTSRMKRPGRYIMNTSYYSNNTRITESAMCPRRIASTPSQTQSHTQQKPN